MLFKTISKNILILNLIILLLFFSCKQPNQYNCPCDSETVITINTKNSHEESIILDAIEKRIGSDCCQYDSNFPDDTGFR